MDMARTYPEGWRELAVTGAAQREIETLALLAEALPERFEMFHGVRWTRVRQGHAAIGEIDFAAWRRGSPRTRWTRPGVSAHCSSTRAWSFSLAGGVQRG